MRDESERADLSAAREALRRVWGYEDFRPGQAEILEAALAGRDLLAILPTGGGKSLCYQLPAVMLPGLTVVVSPLIALMQDQVAALRAVGVSAGALTSATPADELAATRAALWDGSLRLLYIAPERLALGDTAAMLERVGVARLAVDEAHCVSQWGHDFRPDYLSIGLFRRHLAAAGKPVQTTAFTATADEATRSEIVARLFGAPESGAGPVVFVRGFDRPNLRLAFAAKDNPKQQLLRFLEPKRGEAGVIYGASRKGVERCAEMLVAEGHRALPYHAGLDAETRAANQRAFVREDGVVIAATVAFGMGVDKPDVRFVAHLDLPKSVENYYQEVGRAGRDGLPADTLTLYGVGDIALRRQQIDDGDSPVERKREDHARLTALLALAEAPQCRRQTLLAYFGETRAEPCGHCDLCDSPPELFDGSIAAQKALSAAVRTGQSFGAEHLISVLRGETTDMIQRRGHDQLRTFGVGAEFSKKEWRAILRQLYAAGLMSVEVANWSEWRVTEAGWAVLKGEKTIQLRKDQLAAALRPERKAARRGGDASNATSAPAPGAANSALFAALKRKRLDLAREHNSPAYVIFTDRSLLDIAAKRPTTFDALAECHGVGEAKLRRFGQIVLDVVAEVAREEGWTPAAPPAPADAAVGEAMASAAPAPAPAEAAPGAPASSASDPDPALFEALRRMRADLAQARGLPAFMIFSDRTLLDIAARQPRSLEALGECHGVGPAKLESFGAPVLETLAKAQAEADSPDNALFERLRRAHDARLDHEDQPPLALSDETLRAIAARRPATRADLASIAGLEPAALERFGGALMAVLDDVDPERDDSGGAAA